TLQLTPHGLTALRERRSITLTKPPEPKASKSRKNKPGEIECNERLFEHLKQVRRVIADQRDVPAYVIFSDASLREMARDCPENLDTFGLVQGVGKRKLQDFGKIFTKAIAEFTEN